MILSSTNLLMDPTTAKNCVCHLEYKLEHDINQTLLEEMKVSSYHLACCHRSTMSTMLNFDDQQALFYQVGMEVTLM